MAANIRSSAIAQTSDEHSPQVIESMLPSARAGALNDEAYSHLLAGRALLVMKAPYLAGAAFKMRPRRTSQVPTLSSDVKWRMYWNPYYVLSLDVDRVASAWLHEISHVTRGHFERFDNLHEPLTNLRKWNKAADAGINYDIATMSLAVDPGWISFDRDMPPEARPGMTTESIYFLLKDDPSQDEEGDDSESGQEGDEQQDGQGSDTGDRFGRGCGSSVGGPAREWEDPTDDDAVSPGEAELTRQMVAQETAAHERANPGTVPGGWSQWATEVLHPKIDWRKPLRSTVKAAFGNIAGRADYSYLKISRRQIPDVVLPGKVAPEPPQIEVVADTSGSVTDTELNQAMAEVAGVHKAIGRSKPIMVSMCDMVSYPPQKFTGKISRLEIQGRGGTDMRVGLEAAASRKGKHRNDIILCITDGETPWPDEKPAKNRKAIYIAVIFEGSHPTPPPPWMKVITIPADDRVRD